MSCASSMLAITRSLPWQRAHRSISMPKTHLTRCAQLIATWRRVVGLSGAAARLCSPRPYVPGSPLSATGCAVPTPHHSASGSSACFLTSTKPGTIMKGDDNTLMIVVFLLGFGGMGAAVALLVSQP